MFKQFDVNVELPKIEHEVLNFWKENEIFEKRRAKNKGGLPWSFIDGPITANNPMGVHHAWGRTYKDVWQRYSALKGFDERYQNGFDCQGLWVEVEVEKELGFESKRDIEAYGIAEFVKRCKQRVLNYAAVQTEQSIRLGMWMEWDDPEELRKLSKALEAPDKEIKYRSPRGMVKGKPEQIIGRLGSAELGGSYFTLSDENNYMIWKALKICHERGWIYKGADSMPWCPRCSTGISQHEIVTEGYREITHPSIYVKFPLQRREGNLLIWTTTPWTLTSNVAVAVHPNLTYVKIRLDGEVYYLLKSRLREAFRGRCFETLEELKGSEMEGWFYVGPFDELELPKRLGAPDAHRVILWEEIGENEGTGLVHIAPGAGKEDLMLGKKYGLPVVAPLDEFGVFIPGFGSLSGIHVFESAKPIFEDLERKGLVFRIEDYTHRYPVCWRCGSELVFRYVEEWFISMGEKLDKPYEEITPEEKEKNLRYQIMDSASQVRWIPEFGLKRELDWLRNMEDWMISKKRFWGLALPIWVCSKCGWFDVIGDEDELRERAIEGWETLEGHSPHRPYIDAIKIRCERCGGSASRIPDVGNPWLDAGIVAFSTLRYRDEPEYWKKWFPADLITESFPGQFRNWFYSMLAMSTILSRQTPFKTCLGHGSVLAEDGREMHKSWGNAIWFDDAAETMGSDVMRWMYCTTKPENDMLFGYKRAAEVKRDFFIPLINVYNFFAIYAELDGWTPEQKPENLSLLDEWILSKLNRLIEEVTKSLDNYDAYSATMEIWQFLDLLSKWYVRRSRRRFWKSEADDDKNAAYSTLYTCLKKLILLLAPFTPFITEAIYQKMVRNSELDSPESVHLNDWPTVEKQLIKKELIADMDFAIKVASLGRAARNRCGIKLRQPLSEAVIIHPSRIEGLKRFSDIIKDELNVKELRFSSDKGELIKYELKPIAHILGRKHGKKYQKIVENLRNASYEDIKKLASGLPMILQIEDSKVEILSEEVNLITIPLNGYSVMEEGDLIVGVSTVISEDLESEGLARDIIRRIQALRKEANFNIEDTIETYYSGDSKLEAIFEVQRELISTETLSTALIKGEPPKGAYEKEFKIENMSLRLGLKLGLIKMKPEA
ncbi:MAG: class I tRNA ligase family protein [Candidatus Bathyarchaeia archaeon]